MSASSRSRRRSAGSTKVRSTTCCAQMPTRPSPCSPTSPRRPIRSCAPRRGGWPRGCSSAPAGWGTPPRAATRRLTPDRAAGEGDLDLDLTLEVAGGRPRHADELIARRWGAPKRAVCLLVDHSGSMEGHAVGLAAMAAAAVVLTRTDTATTSVIAFAKDALVLQAQSEIRPPRGRARRRTALAARQRPHRPRPRPSDRVAPAQSREPASERLAIVLSDCRPTAGTDPLAALPALDRVHVLGTSDAPDSVAAGRALAARARGRYLSSHPLFGASSGASFDICLK